MACYIQGEAMEDRHYDDPESEALFSDGELSDEIPIQGQLPKERRKSRKISSSSSGESDDQSRQRVAVSKKRKGKEN